MNGTMREIVSALVAESSQEQQQENVLISLDTEDDKYFLLHFIIGTYFGPDFKKHHQNKKSAFQIQASMYYVVADELSGSVMKRVEIERVYHHILSNVDSSLIVKPKKLGRYFIGKRSDSSKDLPLFCDLYPRKLHPDSVRNKYKYIRSIAFINDPDTSCMRQDCVERFKRLTGLESFRLSLSVDVTDTNGVVAVNEVTDEVDESLEPLEVDTCLEMPIVRNGNGNVGTCSSGEESDVGAKPEVISEAHGEAMVGLMDIGEYDDAYLFRVSKRDENFSCKVEDNEKVLVNGDISTSGEESDVAAKPEEVSEAQGEAMVGLMDIGECDDAYLFRVSLPGVKRDERDFSCEVEENGKVLVRGITTTGEKRVERYTREFELKTENLCLPGHFSVSFHLPGPVLPHEFSGNFGTDGILEGIVLKNLQ